MSSLGTWLKTGRREPHTGAFWIKMQVDLPRLDGRRLSLCHQKAGHARLPPPRAGRRSRVTILHAQSVCQHSPVSVDTSSQSRAVVTKANANLLRDIRSFQITRELQRKAHSNPVSPKRQKTFRGHWRDAKN